ncbi:hypothetical protein PENTCL1PPCAC_24798 [Pristionchus entomophagus]|uniref:Uncharacterized protein n=1 Tax=Pristionchus entomophagus TaxID=358040 RepID=A0AAV5U8B1_9BILA|nr:hypothetical protein PENTCL1PPCAC_24798 [Pristionchus entomophagus]
MWTKDAEGRIEREEGRSDSARAEGSFFNLDTAAFGATGEEGKERGSRNEQEELLQEGPLSPWWIEAAIEEYFPPTPPTPETTPTLRQARCQRSHDYFFDSLESDWESELEALISQRSTPDEEKPTDESGSWPYFNR